MGKNKIKILTFLFVFVESTSFAISAEKCSLKGDLIRWEYAYCLTLNETDDCENEAVSKCVGDLDDEYKISKATECENKNILHEKHCTLRFTNKESKEYKSCLKDIPSAVKKGCT
jgi:hypothetical protein